MNPQYDRRRWWVLSFLVASTFLNYFDRQVLSVLKPQIKADFGLSDSKYSLMLSVFMTAYIIMYPIGGRLVDRFGSRRCMLVFVSVWSVATICTGFVGSFFSLLACRFVLGLAEPGNYPAALRASAIWFTPERRGFAISSFSAGSAIGAIVAPPLTSLIALHYGWRGAFIVPGTLGAVWVVGWWVVYREPAVISPIAPLVKNPPRWGELLRNRVLWGLVVARLLSDPVWYFLLFWFPSYIQEKMKLGLGEAGAVGWIPFLVADVGGIGAAAWSDRLIRRGRAPIAARMAVLTSVALLAPLAWTLGFIATNLALTLTVFSVLAFVCTTWLFTLTPLIADAAPPDAIATVHGVAGAFGAAGGLIFNACIGPVVDATGYVPIFCVAGCLHLAASGVLKWTFRKNKPVAGSVRRVVHA